MFNVPIFNEYFLNGEYKKDIGAKNKGIAEEYANLLSKVRNTNKSSSSYLSGYKANYNDNYYSSMGRTYGISSAESTKNLKYYLER